MARVPEGADEIETQAAEWIVRIDLHGTPENWAALDAWLAANPRHRAAFLRLSVAWKRADRLRQLAPHDGRVDADLLAPGRNVIPFEPPTAAKAWADTRSYRAPAEKRRFGSFARSKLAASVAVIAVACGAALAWYAAERDPADIYTTRIGELRRITLDDGSTVALNTNSEVRVRYSENARQVELARGEALFEVAKNKARPFKVEAGRTTVFAVGTAFSVRLRAEPRDERVDVVVTEGRVAINPPTAATYSAGTVAIVRNGRIESTTLLSAEDISGKLAWISGRLVFQGEKLGEVVAEINRYNQRQLEVSDPDIAGVRIGGTFNPSDPQGFIKALNHAFGIKARLSASGDRIELHSGVP